jgi:3-hydroxyisobutyrate dehydrogenase
MAKDLLYAHNEASQCNIELKTAEVARSLFKTAIEQGLGDKDTASVIEPIRSK